MNIWNNRNFLKLWSAQTVSGFGTQTAALAYPLTAILLLHASSFQMGILRAIGSAAAVIVGFFVGVMVDRVNRKWLLIFADLGLAFLATTIAATAYFGVLRIEYLYIIQFFTGALSITSEVTAMAFLPAILKKEELVEGNSKFATTASAATIAGPSISGILIESLTAPLTILIDSVSFVFSAFFVWSIDTPERPIPQQKKERNIPAEIIEGLRFVYRNPVLRPLAEAIALHFLFMLIISTIFTLYAVRQLNLEPFLLGIIFSAFGFGFLFGALSIKKLTNKFGQGKVMISATLLNAFACLLIPLASGSGTVYILFTAHLLLAFGMQIHGINLMSLRQSITPDFLQGRMNGSFRVVNVCMMMIGALASGFLGEQIGLRNTLFIGAAGMFLPFFRLYFSPIRKLSEIKTLPTS
jgi:MFS family permease